MKNPTKSRKTTIVISSLANTQLEKLPHCWKCGEAGHTKKDPNFPQFFKKTQPLEKSKKKEEVVRFEVKTTKKQLKCNYCGKLGHDDNHCFILHLENRPSLKKKKSLKAKLAILEEKLKIVALLGQVIQPEGSLKSRASASNLYIFGAVCQVVKVVATQSQTSV